MPAALQRLPIGIQSFRDIREGDYLYIDKTADILRLVGSGRVVFLSRPRRFGKSLLVSTLEELFKANEPLFRGLTIHDKWDWTKKYPVIRIDWSMFTEAFSLAEMKLKLVVYFQKIAKRYGVEAPVDGLRELIEALYEKTGQRVVVLIDEYDKLMLDAISEPEKFAQMRDFLCSVYGVLKPMGEYLHFVFLTGVSKFAGVSIFSGLNNLEDITLVPDFATLCGYTPHELEENFAGYIDETARSLNCEKTWLLDKVKFWYNGYSWDGKTSVYNPFSILPFFKKALFENFWFQSGTPSFLIKILQSQNDLSTIARPAKVSDLRGGTGVGGVSFEQLLFQTGYLTIKKIEMVNLGECEYTLDFPNFEVQESFLNSLFCAYFPASQVTQETLTKRIANQLIPIASRRYNNRTLFAALE